MLRESVENHDQNVDLSVVMQGGDAREIQFHQELIAFAEAIVTGTEPDITMARENLLQVAGSEVVVDAAGVASNFQRMVRIADSTGIELGVESVVAETEDLRSALGINAFRKA
jgi:hypothetical protein